VFVQLILKKSGGDLVFVCAEGLAESSTHFRSSSRRLAKKAWWQQFRLKLILGAIVVTIIIVVISE